MNQEKKPIILVVNDDGYFAPGIRTLIEVVKPLGKVIVVAPDKSQSGMGHAVTISHPLRIHEICKEENYQEYSCNGTPVDCVKIGQKVILRQKPDLIVSGINHGSNSSVNVLYSGTMAGVLEGAMENIPAIGFSLADHSLHAEFNHCVPYIKTIVQHVLKHGLPAGTCLNVNFPQKNSEPIRGVKICRQANAFWDEGFDERKDPQQRDYFWLRGSFVVKDTGSDTDEWALANNYVSIVPTQIDLTAHHLIEILSKWDF